MEWRRKSELDEPYCAVHNVDCPLHDHSGDPMVLHINPMRVPTGWVCPQAVIEFSEDHHKDARKYREENEPSAAGFIADDSQEEIIMDAFVDSEWIDEAEKVRLSGAESLTVEEIDGAIHCIEQNIDHLPSEASELRDELIDFWEEQMNE